MNRKLAVILGIRPDVIRASIVLELLRACPDCDLRFVWTGQHYSDNLKDVFFRELNVQPPDIELGARGETDAEVAASVIAHLYPVLDELRPAAAVFLGDTNSVIGCIAAAQLNIPIVHIEGCMRSYDWRMPEEKYRTVTDHLSDIIYAYCGEYRNQGVAEGINPGNIVVVGNLIVDVLNRHYFDKKADYDAMATEEFFSSRKIRKGCYYLMTCHRRENVADAAPLRAILELVAQAPSPVYFPAGYRTQRMLLEFGLTVPSNLIVVDPIGYREMLCLVVNSRGVLTDSGTVVEETCVLQVPSVQMRKSTERPQVYDAGSSIKFDPGDSASYPGQGIFQKLESLYGKPWEHGLGDGQSSRRITEDLRRRLAQDDFRRHRPEQYHIPVARSFRGDGLPAEGANGQ